MSFGSSGPFALFHFAADLAICASSWACAWILWRLSRGRAAGVVFGGALGLLPWLLSGALEGTIWGFCLAARALWTTATVAAPVAACAAAIRTRRPAWLVPAALLLLLKWTGESGTPADLEVQRATIEVAGLKSPVRVAHFSDLQTDGIRPMELRARDAANAFAPDFVVFTGDTMNDKTLLGPVEEYLAGFTAAKAKLFVGGDVDGWLDRKDFSERSGFRWIDGRVETFAAGGTKVAFLGFGLLDYRKGPEFAGALSKKAAKAGVRLALSHRPDAAFALAGLPVAVLFSGHTHGGQVVIPGFGPPVTLTRVPRAIAAGGVSSFEGLRISLARGLGWEGHIAPRVRMFCRPHLILAELVPPAK